MGIYKKLAIAGISGFFLVFPAVIFAQLPVPTIPTAAIPDIWTLVVRVLQLIWPVFVGAAIIAFFIAGFLFVTADGEMAKVKTARDALIWGTVGVIVAVLAFTIPIVVQNTILGTNPVNNNNNNNNPQCAQIGAACGSGAECCSGYCPTANANPGNPPVCGNPPTGACCLSGTCSLRLPSQCVGGMGGSAIWIGGDTCQNVNCPSGG